MSWTRTSLALFALAAAAASQQGKDVVLRVSCSPVAAVPEPAWVFLDSAGGKRTIAERDEGRLVFHDVAEGVYSIAIEDPRFRPWTQPDVHPGMEVDAVLEGSCTLRLAFRDATTGVPVAPPKARYTHFDEDGQGGSSTTIELGEAGVTLRLLPGVHLLLVPAEGYVSASLNETLAVGEERSIDVAFSQGVVIGGHIRLSDGSLPATPASVLLLHAGPHVRRDKTLPGLRPMFTMLGGLLASAVSDPALQEFRFSPIDPGSYDVAVSYGGLFASLRVEALESQTALELVLPPGGVLAGTCRVPSSVPMDDVRLVLRPIGEASERWMEAGFAPPDLRVFPAADGSYASDLLMPGEYKLNAIVEPTNPAWGGRRILPIRHVFLVAGETTELEVDLTARLPGAAKVRVERAGKPWNEGTVTMSRQGSTRSLNRPIDERGDARFDAIEADEWTVRVIGRGGVVLAERSLTVAAAAAAAVTIEVP
jgi:hypothetical protein